MKIVEANHEKTSQEDGITQCKGCLLGLSFVRGDEALLAFYSQSKFSMQPMYIQFTINFTFEEEGDKQGGLRVKKAAENVLKLNDLALIIC